LQSEIASTLKDRPKKAEVDFFISKLVENEKGEKYRITADDAKKINKLLYKHDLIDEEDKITFLGREIIEKEAIPLPDTLELYRASVANLLKIYLYRKCFQTPKRTGNAYTPYQRKLQKERVSGVVEENKFENDIRSKFRYA